MRLRPVSLLLVVCSSNAALAAQTSVSPTPVVRGPGSLARVAYVSDEAQNDVLELYSTPVDGSVATLRLNGALPAGGDVAAVNGLPMLQVVGDRVLYVADQLTNDVHEFFSVPSDGSATPVRLNGPLVTGGDVTAFLAAKQRVVFVADGTVDERKELYSAPLDGSSPPIPLTPLLAPGFDVYKLVQFTRDGSSVVFTTTSLGGLREFLYVVPTNGSQPALLLDDSGPPPALGYSYLPDIAIARGDDQVVYVVAAYDDVALQADLFSARLDGSTPPIQLNPVQGAVTYSGTSPGFRIAPGGQRVLFVERKAGSSDLELQSVHLDGSGLVGLVPAGETADRRHYDISRDASCVVFATYGGSGASLYLSTLDGSLRVSLLGPLAATTIMDLQLIPGDAGLVFATGSSGDTVQLHALHAPHQPLTLTGSLPAAQGANLATNFDPLGFTPDGTRLVFRGDLHTDEVDELYSVLLDGSQPAQRLNPPLSGERDVWSFRLTPDGGRVLYLADQTADNRFELFSVPVDGSAAPAVLNSTPVTGGDVLTYAKPAPSGRFAPGF